MSGLDWWSVARLTGYSSGGAAYNGAMAILKNLPREDTGDLRILEGERLSAMQDALWKRCMRGDEWAIDRVLKIMDRRAKLLGLDKPPEEQKVDITLRIRQVAEQEGIDPDIAVATALRLLQDRVPAYALTEPRTVEAKVAT